MGESDHEEKTGRHLGLGRITDAVEKGFETLSGHGTPCLKKKKKSVDKDQKEPSVNDPQKPAAIEDKSEAAKKEALRFTASTKPEPKADTLMTSSTTSPSTSKAAPSRTESEPHVRITHHSSSDPTPGDHGQSDDGVDDDNCIVFHKDRDLKFGSVYWRHGFSLPENGRMILTGQTLSFKGIIGTKISFDLGDVDVEKVSRMGGLVHDAFEVSVKSSDTKEGETKFLFSTVLKDSKKVFDKIQSAIANVRLVKEEEEFDTISGRGGGGHNAKKKKFRMTPDSTLKKMSIIGERKLKGVSLQDYYEVAWSENQDCDKKPLYGPFLEKEGKNNVALTKWETGNYKGDWCGEAYTHERIVTFNFMKQTIGQTLVEVKHTQQYRRTNNDQFIVQIKMEMKGFPYADCFVLAVRHVISRVGDNDLSVQIGMYVLFLKSCMFEKKIKTNTGAETTRAQLALLNMTLEGCAPYVKEAAGYADESDDDEETLERERALTTDAPNAVARHPIKLPEPLFKALRLIAMAFLAIFRTCLMPYIQPELFDPFTPSTVEDALLSARARMKLLENISLKSVSERRRKDVSREIASIEKSISRIEKMSTKAD